MKYTNEKIIYFDVKIFRKLRTFLAYSNYYYIRKVIANEGYGLDVLINDPDWRVRSEVARQSYRLDVLVNDSNKIVRGTAKRKLNEIYQ